MKKRLFIIPFILLALIFTVSVNAEETAEHTPPTYVEPNIVISADSVNDGVLWDIMYDAITDKTVVHLTVDTFGVCIYDNPETTYIDGIRLNGETVDSLKFPIDLSKENKIVIRTVYKDDFTGTLAQIKDGTYDYTNLLTNPVGLLTVGYYILALIAVLVSIISAIRGKNKKVKTSEDIAAAVDTRAESAFNALTINFMTEVSTVLEPFFKSMSDTQETIVEAIVLMNSKEPNSHLAALECLKKVASKDATALISQVGEELTNTVENAKAHMAQNLEELIKIAEPTQEESANVELPIL